MHVLGVHNACATTVLAAVRNRLHIIPLLISRMRCCCVLLCCTICSPFQAARYHSLVISQDACPDDLEITAWTEDGTIMAVQHKK
jgi:anthranilate/para-aminobenzoate synthase component II